MKVKDGDFVMPGDVLGIIEQFLPGEGTYDNEGYIKSSILGNVQINSKMKTVTNEQVKELLPIIWHNASKDGLVTLSQYLVGQAGTIVCSLFLSLEETGIYSLTMQIITIISSFSSVMYTVSQPSLQACRRQAPDGISPASASCRDSYH